MQGIRYRNGSGRKVFPSLLCMQMLGFSLCSLSAPHLVCHDHDLPIAKSFQRLLVLVGLFVLQPYNLDDVVDLSILHDLQKVTR